jgi:hypothetical protein
LAVTPQAITAVEVLTTRAGHRLTQAAEMPLPSEVESATSVRSAWKEPAEFGAALKAFLQANRFTASRCVIGLDATHLAAREKRLPTAAAATLTDILRIAAEQDFASEGQDLMTDFVPGPSEGGASALLAAAPRPIVEQLVAAAGAAGLEVVAVSGSALALARATAPSAAGGDRLVLSLSPDSAELVVQSGGAARLLRRLAPRTKAGAGADPATRQRYLADLEADLRRGLALSAAQTQTSPTELLIWNAAGLEAASLLEMGARLDVPTRVCALASDMPRLAGEAPAACRNAAPAAALALDYASKDLPLDFLHSRLAVAKRARFGRVAIWSSVGAAVLIAGIVWLVVDWQNNQREIESMDASLAGKKASLVEANLLIAKTRYAQGWYDRRPKLLECLRELAVTFPDINIWANSLNVREDMHVILSGKATDDQVVISFQKRLQADPRISVVGSPAINGKPGSREVSFSINFTFVGAG